MLWQQNAVFLRRQGQATFASIDFSKYAKTTKRQVFLQQMNEILPWRDLIQLIEPHYPKAENGRPAISLEKMLRMHFLQHWFALSDPAAGGKVV